MSTALRASRNRSRSTGADRPEAARLKRLRAALRSEGFGGALITNPPDIRYLTGFHGADSWLLATPRRAVVVSDFRFQEELEAVTRASRGVRARIRSGSIIAAAVEEIEDALPRGERLAIQAEHVSVALREGLAKRLGAKRLAHSTGLIADLRVRKDAVEIAQIAKAVRTQEKALLAVLEELDSGQRESAIAARLIYEMSAAGSSEPAFDVIVAARANGSLPHAIPGRTTTKKGDPLLIDWGATVGGYRSDMTRTFSLGRWKREMRNIYEVTLEAQLEAIERIGPGVRCSEVDAAARDMIDEAGYGDRFGHGLGHGVGLDIHEGPRLAKASEDVLEPGMVVTVEPGIYLPGVGGVRIEDLVVVTERGRRNLSSLPKDLDWATR